MPILDQLDYSTSEGAERESYYHSELMASALQIAGGPTNVFPMLGVYNQGSTINEVGDGFPLSSGTPAGYNLSDAFNVNGKAWRSIQQGEDVIKTPSYIGYDFGTVKTEKGKERYFPSQPKRVKISTIKIKQGEARENRAAQIRIEASDDGNVWHRVDVAQLPHSDMLTAVKVRSIAPYRMWRIVPTLFNGIVSNSQWEVLEVQMLAESQVSLENIEDYVLLENRDRSYSRSSVLLKAHYELLDVQTELAKFGINLPQTYIFTVHFGVMVSVLGRPVVIGDIVELPGEVQYDPNLNAVRKWLEVTDTGWSTEGYTQNWKPQLFRFYAQPILPSVEHKDILGVPGQIDAIQDDNSFLTGLLQNDQAQKSTEVITQAAAEAVPETGQDPQDIQSGKPLLGPAGGYDGNDLYVADAIPPNDICYTVGDTLPDPTTIKDLHYHRQTYTCVHASIRPPDRLLRYYASIGRWKVVEVNTRGQYESNKKSMSSIMSSPESLPIDHKI